MSEERYHDTGVTYDFSGEEPADQPAYQHTGDEADFTDEALDPPPVIELRDMDGGFPNPMEIGRWIVEFPWRILRRIAGQDSGEDDGESEERTGGSRER